MLLIADIASQDIDVLSQLCADSHDITMRKCVLLHRVANTLNCIDIKTVIVSCGTCLDQLVNRMTNGGIERVLL